MKVGDKGENVKLLQRALVALAYIVKVDGIYGPKTCRAVMDFQRAKGLAINGDATESTLRMLAVTVPAEAPEPDRLARAGELAVAEALRMWAVDVYDPRHADESENAKRCKRIIGDIITHAGWNWALTDGEYLGNGPPQWCGLFAASCWRVAGIDPLWLATFWASTARLASWIRYRDWNGKDAGSGTGRLVMRGGDTTFEPRAGDVVIVGDGTPEEGDHITLLLTREGDDWHTISGNGGGVGPTGKPREGISKQTYHVNRGGYRVLWVMRPGVGDLLP